MVTSANVTSPFSSLGTVGYFKTLTMYLPNVELQTLDENLGKCFVNMVLQEAYLLCNVTSIVVDLDRDLFVHDVFLFL